MIGDQSDNLLRRITEEHVFLTVLVTVSLYMFLESYSFREPSGLFPRFIAGVTVVAAFVLLFRNYLPESLQAFAEDSGDVFESHEEEVTQVSQNIEAAERDAKVRLNSSDTTTEFSDTEAREESRSPSFRDLLANKRFRLTSLTTGYVLLSYLIGFLFATPLFVLTYSLSVNHKWYVTAGLTFVTYQVVDIFMLLLNVQLSSGVLVG